MAPDTGVPRRLPARPAGDAAEPGRQDAQPAPGHDQPAHAGGGQEAGLHRPVQGADQDGPGDIDYVADLRSLTDRTAAAMDPEDISRLASVT